MTEGDGNTGDKSASGIPLSGGSEGPPAPPGTAGTGQVGPPGSTGMHPSNPSNWNDRTLGARPGGGHGAPPLNYQQYAGHEKKNRSGFGMTILIGLIAGIAGALLVLLLMPFIFGVNPVDLVTGNLKKTTGTSSGTNGTVKVVSPTEGALSVANIASEAIPSIVNIDIRAPQQGLLFDLGEAEGTGSGVIFTEDGYIITNNHVIADATEIKVTLASGEELQGKKVGADPETDIAVVKVDKTGLPVLETGDSDKLVVGELCIAVGSPFGYEQSVTAGIISALQRIVTVGVVSGQDTVSVLTDLIQTDAAINPGNSGGALCDSKARLIGVNTVIATSAGGSEGVGFAIPVNTVKKVAEDIIAGRPVSHPYMGVLGTDVTKDLAESSGLSVENGAYLTRVLSGGPADKAGIKVGDVIVEVDGEAVKGMDSVVSIIRKHNVGDKIEIVVYSGDKKKVVEVVLEEKPSSI
ncbi:MAG: trypsin-like peptidase domain-containing protein [Actinobacteria bacterium]|nr:trypsin-like peptidase domain-containing protein [Actinomycetota bacterium]